MTRTKRRWHRAIPHGLSWISTTALFVVSLAAGILVHLDAPVCKRLVVTVAHRVLGDLFEGTIAVDHIGKLSLFGVADVRGRVLDASGEKVLDVSGITIQVRTLRLLRSLTEKEIVVEVPYAAIGSADVNLDTDASSNPPSALRLVRAFALRHPSTEPSKPGGSGVRVDAPTVFLGQVHVHGQMLSETLGGASGPNAPPTSVDLRALTLGVHYDDASTRAELRGVDLAAHGLPKAIDPSGHVRGSFAMPSKTGQTFEASAAFDGAVARAPTKLSASIDGSRVDATLDVRDADGSAVRTLVSGVDVHEPVVLHGTVKGDLPDLSPDVHLTVGASSVDVSGTCHVAAPFRVNLTASAKAIDVRTFRASLPSSSIGLSAHADLTMANASAGLGGLEGTVSLDSTPSKMAGQTAPPIHLRGTFSGKKAQIAGRVQDARMPTTFTVDAQSTETRKGTGTTGTQGIVAKVGVSTAVPELAEVAKLVGVEAAGSAKIVANGTLRFPEQTIDATATVDGTGISYQENVVDEVHAKVRVSGPVERPVVDVETRADGIWLGTKRIPSLDVHGQIGVIGNGFVLRGGAVDLSRRGVTASVRAESVEIQGSRISVRGAEIEGLGQTIRADVRQEPRGFSAIVDAPSIDLSRVAKLTDLHDLHGGTVGLRGSVLLTKDSPEGSVHATFDNVSYANVRGGKATLDATLEGRQLSLDLDAEVDRIGRLSLHGQHLFVDGHPARLEAWRGASGRLSVNGEIDLKELLDLLPSNTLPVEASGKLSIVGTIARDDRSSPPEARVNLTTRGLSLRGRAPAATSKDKDDVDKVTVHDVPTFHVDGIDVGLDLRVDGTSGNSEVALRLTDAQTLFLAFDAKATLPYREFFEAPSSAISKLEDAPLSVRLVWPRRAISKMPTILGTRNVTGTIEADLEASGTLRRPQMNLSISARSLRDAGLRKAELVDADFTTKYDGAAADVTLDVRNRGRHWLALTSRIEADVHDWLSPRGPGQTPPWRAQGKLSLDGFDLGSVGWMADQRIRGRLSGTVSLDDLHDEAKLRAHLELQDASIGRAQYPRGNMDVDARDGALKSSMRIEQTDGFVEVAVSSGLSWGKELVPSLDPSRPVEARLSAKAFRAAAFLPFARQVLNELDGRIDADATFALDPQSKATKMGGQIRFREGVVQAVSFGDELRDASGTVTLRPDGVIVVDGVQASGAQGKVTADAQVVTRGLSFVNASANVRIAEKEALDLVLQGQPFGQFFGTAKIDVDRKTDGKKLNVAVDVPKLQIKLAQSLKVGVQELSRNENIDVGVFTDPSTFVKLRLDKEDVEPTDEATNSTTEIDVQLGQVVVSRGSQMKVTFSGHPHIVLASGNTEMTGKLELRSGNVDVQGKQFKVESGTITFQPTDPSNPIVVATAVWDAGDGTRVFADFVGPVKHGKMTLRSEPSLPPNEILALVMFGSSDGLNGGASSGAAGTTAIGAGGGLATRGLTDALDGLAGIQATARIDTSQANNPRPELEVQVSPTVSVQVAHVLGTPPITDPDLNLVTIDWRFRRNWALETTVGDKGKAMMDAVWQKRY